MSDRASIEELLEKSVAIRKRIVRMIGKAGSGHPGGSLSVTDLLAVLFFHEMRYDPGNPGWRERDRFILSKGHAAPALYAVFAEAGCFPADELESFRTLGSPFQGHPDKRALPILEASTGSLGQGLSIGTGMALALGLDNVDSRVYVVLGDGEVQEGQVWEAAMFAAHRSLGSLTAIIDNNGFQLDDRIDKIVSLEPLAKKWESFGWHVQEIDGHDAASIISAFASAREVADIPSVRIAHTVKGKGVSFMENDNRFHGAAPTREEMRKALEELDEEDIGG